jgi:predicted DNA-binding protein
MSSEVVSLRLPQGTLEKLKLLACRLSLNERREIRWTRIVREAIRTILSENEEA